MPKVIKQVSILMTLGAHPEKLLPFMDMQERLGSSEDVPDEEFDAMDWIDEKTWLHAEENEALRKKWCYVDGA